MDGGLLLVLQHLLQDGSVTRTARSLNLGQSTISHSLARLRELFDDPLFIRRPHGLEPTQRALALKPQIEALLNLTRETLGIGHSFDPTTANRRFSLSAPEFVTIATASSLLNAIETQAPGVGVQFLHLPEAEVFDRLRRGEVDVAIGRFAQAPAEIELTLLYEDTFCLACRKGHPVAKGKMTPKKYQSAIHIWANSSTETTEGDSAFDYSNFRGSTVPRWLTALVIAAQSDYVATCPRRLAESQSDLLELDIVELANIEPVRVVLACRKDLNDRGVDWFVQQINNLFT